MRIEQRLADLGLHLPAPLTPPPGVTLKFPWVRILGQRALISGHGPLQIDGTLLQPLGRVGVEVTEEQGYQAARATALAMLASLKATLGDLDRISGWARLFGMVNTAPDFNRHPIVMDGCTDVLLEIFGEACGAHARSAIGVAGPPLDIPVEIEGEVVIDGASDPSAPHVGREALSAPRPSAPLQL
jgi:hypothetical protein